MYRYDEIDREVLADRTAEFRSQVQRRLTGDMTEDQFKPLRLMNGLYLQLHAYMLRVCIPYGSLNSTQVRALATIARTYDKGYGHITTRQNIQFNWVKLKDTPDILEALAAVNMHAIQTSGNCIRNTTSDPFAGATAEEVDDPRVWCEVIRQWSTFHPEFTYLPRKFKIAVTGAERDRAAVKVHDIGLILRRGSDGTLGFEVLVGGGQGRTPYIGSTIRQHLPVDDLLSYLEAILRVYNRYGRRDNKYKARIKVLVASMGAEEFGRHVEAEWAQMTAEAINLPPVELARIRAAFTPAAFESLPTTSAKLDSAVAADRALARFVRNNVKTHKQPGYAIVEIALKAPEATPGDVQADQLDVLADLAERFSLNDIRATHEQNMVLAHVKKDDLPEVYAALAAVDLASPNIGLISDIIACPGLDYCALANARAIPIAQDIARRFADLDAAENIGELKIKISGCINACGHHHVAHIGILGVDKKGEEYYQLSLGGSAAEDASLAQILGPALTADRAADAVEVLVTTYLGLRDGSERFLDTLRRVGMAPFKEAVYVQAH
jgi:sulfite reductase (NADPH) hemoprotein beta-component